MNSYLAQFCCICSILYLCKMHRWQQRETSDHVCLSHAGSVCSILSSCNRLHIFDSQLQYENLCTLLSMLIQSLWPMASRIFFSGAFRTGSRNGAIAWSFCWAFCWGAYMQYMNLCLMELLKKPLLARLFICKFRSSVFLRQQCNPHVNCSPVSCTYL